MTTLRTDLEAAGFVENERGEWVKRGRILADGSDAKTAAKIQPEGSERELHDEIIAFCKERQWLLFHGSIAHKTFRTRGEGDFHCLLPGGVVLFVECKTKHGKLSSEQLGISSWMDRLGHKLHVVRSISEFKTLCQNSLQSEIQLGV